MTKEEVLKRLEEIGSAPKRSLGQNFLVSENVISKIIESVRKRTPETLIEIGPGLGALTEAFLETAPQKFVVIELDRTFAEFWRGRASRGQRLEVMEEDALRVDWLKQDWPGRPLVLVSNLPYQISAPLVMELSALGQGGAPFFNAMILMFQKEVAERITARPQTKDYGTLSVVAQNRWRVSKVVDAAPACFHPRPQIASRVLAFDFDPDGFGSPSFLKFVRQGFQNRRKLLIKSLKAVDPSWEWSAVLEKQGHSATVRAEELTPSNWKELFHEHQNRRRQ